MSDYDPFNQGLQPREPRGRPLAISLFWIPGLVGVVFAAVYFLR